MLLQQNYSMVRGIGNRGIILITRVIMVDLMEKVTVEQKLDLYKK